MSSTIQRLQAWFDQNCDGDWEHDFGVSIQSCDNPGWWVKIDIRGTPLEHNPFENVRLGVDDDGHASCESWLHCYCEEGVWNGAGDAAKLEAILECFLDWSESAMRSS